MYIVNTTFMVSAEAHDRWIAQFKEHYLPTLNAQGYTRQTFTRVLSAQVEDHHTYSLQIEVDDMKSYKELSEGIIADYIANVKMLFGEGVLCFVTLMKRVELV